MQKYWIGGAVVVLATLLGAWYVVGGESPEPEVKEAPAKLPKQNRRKVTKLASPPQEAWAPVEREAPTAPEGPLYAEDNVRSLLEEHIGDRDIPFSLDCDPMPCVATLLYPTANKLSLSSQRSTGGLQSLGEQTIQALEDAKSLQGSAEIGLHTDMSLVSMKRGRGTAVVLIAQHDPPSDEDMARAKEASQTPMSPSKGGGR